MLRVEPVEIDVHGDVADLRTLIYRVDLPIVPEGAPVLRLHLFADRYLVVAQPTAPERGHGPAERKSGYRRWSPLSCHKVARLTLEHGLHDLGPAPRVERLGVVDGAG